MVTIDTLRAYGANVDEGIARCMNNEGFYLMLVKKVLNDNKLDQLEKQINEGDLASAFETAHTLKGMYANLSLTPLTDPVSKMTELLRGRTETDYSPMISEAKKQFEKLCSL